ncbi:pyridine nucleotide-disulfide oxidoreductase [Sorangium cellulosum]|uniref:Pyridine nucleotide-disulfide oxidoreductase n=1 Tax=Sorangium cellulosum TaxID=56 RepID=A0A2L0FB01_SORCE|nr:NAD(P)/FAD-dependent oxidoreductase [Sorangium cellulosum]AUX48677.1 pyridine nucleotide-disulfide oxidoreductase [Sorangium cellulosum]
MSTSREDLLRYDVIIVGAGPAGLSAALILGRCRRRVLVCDSRRYRNDAAQLMHGFLSRDGVPPAELRRIGREQLAPYGVEIRDVTVVDLRAERRQFEVTLEGGERLVCRKLLLATGLVDRLPELPGLAEMYGKSVHHCPYCDGWEARDQPIGVYGQGCTGVALALNMKTWSRDVVLFSDGPASLPEADAARLARHEIAVREERIARLEGKDGMLERVVFTDGSAVARRALFVKARQEQGSELARKLRCEVTEERGVETADKHEETTVEGVFVAGDASKDVLLAIMAAAEGADAAFGINCALQEEDLA